MPISPSSIVDVRVSLAASASSTKRFRNNLLLTADNSVVSASERSRTYTSLDDVADDFDAANDVYKHAAAWFGQRPGRYIVCYLDPATRTSRIVGGTASAASAITGGSLTLTYGGVSIFPSSWTGVTDKPGIATAITAVITASTDAALDDLDSVVYDADADAFSIVATDDGDLDVASIAGTAEDEMGWDTATETSVFVEDVADAISRVPTDFSLITVADSIANSQDRWTEIATWVQGASDDYVLGLTDTNDTAVEAVDTASIAHVAKQRGFWRTHVTYTSGDGKLADAVNGLAGAVDYDAAGAVASFTYKTLAGLSADAELDDEDVTNLQSKNANCYAKVADRDVYLRGTMAGERDGALAWLDVIRFSDWFKYDLRDGLINLLRTARSVPANPVGVGMIRDVVARTCRRGILNGGIGAGTVSDAQRADIRTAIGNPAFDGDLPTGYLIHIGDPDDRSDADKANRVLPDVRVWYIFQTPFVKVVVGVQVTA